MRGPVLQPRWIPGLGVDEPSIVIQFTTHFILAGFSGESQPRCIIAYQEACEHVNSDTLFPICLTHLFGCTAEESVSVRSVLFYIFLHIFYYRLLVDPRQRRILFVESSPFWSISFKQCVTYMIFETFQAASIAWVLGALTTVLCTGRADGLVIDIGYNECTVIPIFDRRVLSKYIQCTSRGGRLLVDDAVTDVWNIYGMMEERFRRRDRLSSTFIERITSPGGPSFASSVTEASGHTSFPPLFWILYTPELSTASTIPSSFEDDPLSHPTLLECIYEALVQCPMDLRKCLAENMIVTGEVTVVMPSFVDILRGELQKCLERIQKEEKNQMRSSRYHHLLPLTVPISSFSESTTFPSHTLAWVGASLLVVLMQRVHQGVSFSSSTTYSGLCTSSGGIQGSLWELTREDYWSRMHMDESPTKSPWLHLEVPSGFDWTTYPSSGEVTDPLRCM